jgi:dUTP pyrophosphatase
MSSIKLFVKKLSPLAVLPVRGSAGAAGYDLSSAKDTVVPARGKALVPTDLSIALPPGVYGRISPRSSLAWKNSIDVGAGVIDEDYRGAVGVILFNHSDVDFVIKTGDRIAQLILERIAIAEVEDVGDAALDETLRGAGGYGSTGVSDLIAHVAAPAAKRQRTGDSTMVEVAVAAGPVSGSV